MCIVYHSRIRHLIIIAIFITFVTLTIGWSPVGALLQDMNDSPEITMTVPFEPIPVESTDGMNIAYELELTTPNNTPVIPETLEVIDQASGNVIYTENTTMLASLYHPASIPPGTPEELLNGTPKHPLPRITIWFKVSPDAVPDKLIHNLTLNRTTEGLSPITITGGEVLVRKDLRPVIIDSPVKGSGWVIIETTSPFSHHVTSQITMNNVTRVPQRYAQDFLYLDPNTGVGISGDETVARDYLGFGKELYSVADGTVVIAQDGFPDIEITTEKPPASVDTAAGNNVIIDIGDGKYACYGHMINGSVRVKPGDTVTSGQIIGLMGNSGNSDAPHLHFQIVTGTPSFLGAEGYPHVYRSFNITGTFNETSMIPTFFEIPIPQTNRLMENDVIVSFPKNSHL